MGRTLFALLLATLVSGCSGVTERPRLTMSASALGAEADLLRDQLARFQAAHPGVEVGLRVTPDAADQRHQVYVQWLNGHADEPDVLQLDIIWTPEFAAAGWIRPLDLPAADLADFVPAALDANRWQDALYAVPWFVDLGLLYWRTDLMDAAPTSVEALVAEASRPRDATVPYGLVWQGARYEGLVTVFIEHLTAFGGAVFDEQGRVRVDAPEAVRALTVMREMIEEGVVPVSALTWQEEQTRFAFQNGQAVFMRNWPYAWALLEDPEQSRVAGRVGVAAFPASAQGRPAAALGGAQLAVNRFSREPALAWALVQHLTAPDQMLERARRLAQLPARRSVYDVPGIERALPLPVDDVRAALDAAVARPATPLYTELSELLQVGLHRALSGQQTPEQALAASAAAMRAVLARAGLAPEARP